MSQPSDDWFNKSPEYWKCIEPSVNGMLGGYGSLASVDEKDSLTFLEQNVPSHMRYLALDCGAGIGRVSINVLLKIFEKVSLLECNKDFLDIAQKHIQTNQLFLVHNKTIQQIDPCPEEEGAYNLVWFQWVLCYADDNTLCSILKKAKTFLKKDGYIGIKENICTSEIDAIDEKDHSVIRNDRSFKKVFERSGLKLVSTQLQKNFPKTLYPVRMYLLTPVELSCDMGNVRVE
jgi:protein N-terminal methyltransferase